MIYVLMTFLALTGITRIHFNLENNIRIYIKSNVNFLYNYPSTLPKLLLLTRILFIITYHTTQKSYKCMLNI